MNMNSISECPIPKQLDTVPYSQYRSDSDYTSKAIMGTFFGICGACTIVTNPFSGVGAIALGLFALIKAENERAITKKCWKKERQLSHINHSDIALCFHLDTTFSSTEKLFFIQSVEKANLIAVHRSVKPNQISSVINFLKKQNQNNYIKLLWLHLGNEYSVDQEKLLDELKENTEIKKSFQLLCEDHPHYVVLSPLKKEYVVKNFQSILPINSRLTSSDPTSHLYEIEPITLNVSFYKHLSDKKNAYKTYYAENEILDV